jgi:hypothetical protein
MADEKLIIPLPEAVDAGDYAAIADFLEHAASWFVKELRPNSERTRVAGTMSVATPLLQAAATYRLVAAQQETADLHQIVRQLNERLAKLERG